MKPILIVFLQLFSVGVFAQFDNKALISRKDSLISLNAFIRMDHKIFGFEKPDANSKKMFVLSVFTDDVEGNPHQCPFGAYYDTSGIGMDIKYLSHEGNFVKAVLVKDTKVIGTVYFDKYWVEWEEED